MKQLEEELECLKELADARRTVIVEEEMGQASQTPIAVVMTGGTIGSEQTDDHQIGLKSGAPALPFPKDAVTYEPVKMLSENATAEQVQQIAACVMTAAAHSRAVIVTHGTDTLVWNAALLAYLTEGVRVPVLIVSANHPLGTSGGNGEINFNTACAAAEHLRAGVYVSYCNSGETPTIHRAVRLYPQRPFEDRLDSIDTFVRMDDVRYPKDCIKDNQVDKTVDRPLPPRFVQEGTAAYLVQPTAAALVATADAKAIVVELYHSGTANAQRLRALMKQTDAQIYAVGARADRLPYESVAAIAREVTVLYDIQPLAAYAKAAVLYASLPRVDAHERMMTDTLGERFTDDLPQSILDAR